MFCSSQANGAYIVNEHRRFVAVSYDSTVTVKPIFLEWPESDVGRKLRVRATCSPHHTTTAPGNSGNNYVCIITSKCGLRQMCVHYGTVQTCYACHCIWLCARLL